MNSYISGTISAKMTKFSESEGLSIPNNKIILLKSNTSDKVIKFDQGEALNIP